MNCLDYRRLLLAGEGESAGMSAHRMQCAECAALRREQEPFEASLREALSLPLPQGFESRIGRTLARRRRRFLAAAAVSAMALGAGAYAWLGREGRLALACIDFVMKEEAKSIMMGAMPRADAEKALADTLPLERIERVGQVKFIGVCPFNGATAYHVVLAVPQGKVTLLVMPGSAPRSGERAGHEGLYASVVVLGRGSVGIVGSDAAVVNSVAGALRA